MRKDLGGVDIAPTLIIAFFDDDGARIEQVNGEDKICLGIRSGAIEGIIKEFVDQRMKLKLANEKRQRVIEELLRMDLKTARIPEITKKMNELGINHSSALCREDLFELLKSKIPQLKMTLDVLEVIYVKRYIFAI